MAVAYAKTRVELWDVKTGTSTRVWGIDKEKKKQLLAHGKGYDFSDVQLSPSGEIMAWAISPSGDQKNASCTIFLYDTTSARPLRRIKRLRSPIHKLHLLDEGKTALLMIGGLAGDANTVVDLTNGNERFRIPTRQLFGMSFGHDPKDVARFLGISPDRKSFLTSDVYGIVRWDSVTGKKLGEYGQGGADMAVSSNGKIAVLARGMRLALYNRQFKPLSSRKHFFGPVGVRFFPDGGLLLISGFDDCWQIWNTKQDKLDRASTFQLPQLNFFRPFSVDGYARMASGTDDKGIFVHDMVQNKRVCRLKGVQPSEPPDDPFHQLSENGKRVLVSTKKENQILIRWFDSRSGRELGRYTIPRRQVFENPIQSILWCCRKGEIFGFITKESQLALIDCRTRQQICILGRVDGKIEKEEISFFPEWSYSLSKSAFSLIGNRYCNSAADCREFVVWQLNKWQQLRHFLLKVNRFGDSDWSRGLSRDYRLIGVQLSDASELHLYETATGNLRGKITAPNAIHDFSFSPDGKTLATSCADTTVLIWDLNRPLSGRPIRSVGKAKSDHDKFWKQLADPDAAVAEQAIWSLVRAPKQALDLLQKRLKPIPSPEPKYLADLIAKLGGKNFKQRELAGKEIVKLGELIVPTLRAKMKNMTLEQLRRTKILLAKIEDPSTLPICLREIRAIEVLERIDTPEARRLLKELASGCNESTATHEARLALKRIP